MHRETLCLLNLLLLLDLFVAYAGVDPHPREREGERKREEINGKDLLTARHQSLHVKQGEKKGEQEEKSTKFLSKKKSKNFNFKNLFFSFITDTILSYVRTVKKIHNLKIPKR